MTPSRAAADEPRAEATEVHGMARGGMANLLGATVSACSGIVVVLVVTRGLSRTDSGTVFTLTSAFLILSTVARLGTPTGLVYFISRARADGQAHRTRWIVKTALFPVTAAALLCSLLLVALAEPLVVLMGLDPDVAVAPLRWLAALLPFAVLTEGLLAATRGSGAMRPTVLVDRIGRGLLQIALVVGAVATGSLVAVVVAWAAPYAVAALMAWRAYNRSAPDKALAKTSEQPPTRSQFWSFTAPRSLASVVQIALQRLDIVFVAAFLGPAAATVYTAATRFVVVGQMGNQAVSLAAQPRLGVALARGDVAGANTLYRTATTWLVLINWPLYLLCLLFPGPLLSLFGIDSSDGMDVIVILAVTMLFATACGMVNMVLSMGGRTSWNLYNNLGALALAVALFSVLIPRLGIVGAAVGWAAAIAFNNLLPLCQIAMAQRIHPGGRGPVTAMSLATVAFGLLPGAGLLLGGGWWVAVGIGAGVVVYLCGCWWASGPLRLAELSSVVRSQRGSRT